MRMILPGMFLLMFAACMEQDNTAGPQSYTVVIRNMKFEPATIELNKGDTVTWINNDFVDHDITEEKSKAWRSGVLPAGSKWSKVVDRSDEYFCSIHVIMKGKLAITQ